MNVQCSGGTRPESTLPRQTTESLITFTGQAFTPLLAGFAASFCFSLVKGLIPFARRPSGLFDDHELREAGKDEDAGLLQLLVADSREHLEHLRSGRSSDRGSVLNLERPAPGR